MTKYFGKIQNILAGECLIFWYVWQKCFCIQHQNILVPSKKRFCLLTVCSWFYLNQNILVIVLKYLFKNQNQARACSWSQLQLHAAMSLSYPTWLPGKVQKYKTLFFNSSEILRIFFSSTKYFSIPQLMFPNCPK